jgi:hypothetical protein
MNSQQNLTKATLQGTLWSYTSRYSGKFLVFISTAVLARLLLKEDFGIAGYALVIIGFMEVLPRRPRARCQTHASATPSAATNSRRGPAS